MSFLLSLSTPPRKKKTDGHRRCRPFPPKSNVHTKRKKEIFFPPLLFLTQPNFQGTKGSNIGKGPFLSVCCMYNRRGASSEGHF